MGLVQLIRFLTVELTHLDLNSKFDIGVVFMTNFFQLEVTSPSTMRRS
jgi:hypothetical protein